MRKICSIVFIVMIIGFKASAQDAATLIKEGQHFNTDHKYPEAVAKYKSALAIEPNNAKANYELAFSLFSSGKGLEGIPYLQKTVTANAGAPLTAGAYSLMGSIYSSANQSQKAIEAYRNGIKLDGANQRLFYNLGIAQYKAKHYPDAEASFISAIRIDSSYASSVRMYALSAFHQNKRAEALLGFSRFLMLDPTGPQSAEAFGNLQSILNGGSLKPEAGYKPSAATKAAASVQNALLIKVLNGFANRRYASTNALLTARLKAVFDPTAGSAYYFAPYFGKLSQTEHLQTFTRLISQKAYPENAKWLANNADKVDALQEWIRANAITR